MFRLCNLKKNSACFSGQSCRNSVTVSRYRVPTQHWYRTKNSNFSLYVHHITSMRQCCTWTGFHTGTLHSSIQQTQSNSQHLTYRMSGAVHASVSSSEPIELQGLDLIFKAPQSKSPMRSKELSNELRDGAVAGHRSGPGWKATIYWCWTVSWRFPHHCGHCPSLSSITFAFSPVEY